jgi:hypothetical protein
MNAPAVSALETEIRNKELDKESRHYSITNSRKVVAPIGADANPDGVVVSPTTPAPAETTPSAPEIHSSIEDPALHLAQTTDMLNRGDYHGYMMSSYAPHAPVQPVALHPGDRTFSTGTTQVQSAIQEASAASGINLGTLRAIASIESDNNPGSNRNRSTQYKGLFQIGKDEWRRYGEGDIYNARDNAMAAARMLADHRTWFQRQYGRAPSDTELYMMHQQGRGFFTRGAMTNIHGNPYPGMRGPQSHRSFQAGWGKELERRKMLLSGPEFVGA